MLLTVDALLHCAQKGSWQPGLNGPFLLLGSFMGFLYTGLSVIITGSSLWKHCPFYM